MNQLPIPAPRYEILGPGHYRCLEAYVYRDEKTGETKTIPEGRYSDGASGALDIYGAAWWVHDEICLDPFWDSGALITAKEAARVLSHILWTNGRKFRALYWGPVTFLFGCKGARSNGWF